MAVITIAAAREHLEIIGTDQDAKIAGFIDAAEAHAAQYMGRPLQPWDEDEGVADPPADVCQAILLLVGDMYELRTAGITGISYAKNPAAEALMHFHRRGLGV